MIFPLPEPVNPGHGSEYGPPVMPVHEWYPGVEVVQAVPGDPVSCASAGNCDAGGYYIDRSGLSQAFVVGKT